jgi:hypothetical protein
MNRDDAELVEIQRELLTNNIIRIKRLVDLALGSSMLEHQDPRIADEYRRMRDSVSQVNRYLNKR